jgi:hypothetical protein
MSELQTIYYSNLIPANFRKNSGRALSSANGCNLLHVTLTRLNFSIRLETSRYRRIQDRTITGTIPDLITTPPRGHESRIP